MVAIEGSSKAPSRRVHRLFFPAAGIFLAAFGMPLPRMASIQDLSTAFTAADRPSMTWTACTLLSRPELEEIVTVPLTDGEAGGKVATACLFGAKSGGRVVVVLHAIPTSAWSSEQVERMEQGAREGSYREVPELGDRSFLFDMGARGAAICVFRGDYYLQISVFGLGAAPKLAPAVERLARRAVVRLSGFQNQ